MSSTSFILAPSHPHSSPPPPAPTLHLLPFALGSSSNPYRTTQSSSRHYFTPRPAASTSPGVPPDALLAAFRGRALVGHPIPVPRGYQGVVLSTTARPDRGGFEDRRSAPKLGASADARDLATPGPSDADAQDGGSARLTRARGAGQVALARPRTRQPPKRQVGRKRIKLDSDEEEGEGEGEATRGTTSSGMDGVGAQDGLATPKRPGSGESNIARAKSETPSQADLPVIVVQHPTPRKPLAPAPTDTSLAPTETSEGEAQDDERVQDEAISSEHIVPSPATENDPPPFPLSPRQSLADVSALLDQQPDTQSSTGSAGNETEATAVRVLRPSSTFTQITLWTPDAPLAGFRADEAQANPAASAQGPGAETATKAGEGGESVHPEPARKLQSEEDAGIKLHPGWWRVGGAGEGGDEFVRAMGEWLGLVEMINEPVYLQGEEMDSEDDE